MKTQRIRLARRAGVTVSKFALYSRRPRWDDVDAWHELKADLLTVSVEEARLLGEMGVLHALDRFSDANESALNAVFFPGVLNQFRAQGAALCAAG